MTALFSVSASWAPRYPILQPYITYNSIAP